MSDTALLDQIILSNLPAPNRAGHRVPAISYVRDIGEADLAQIADMPPAAAPPTTIRSLRHKHHNCARLIADGLTGAQLYALSGYTATTISHLKSDPMFQELVTYYQQQREAKYLDVHERIGRVGLLAVDIIEERLENPDEVEKLTTSGLVNIAESLLDRSIAPSRTTAGGRGAVPTGTPPISVNISFPQTTQAPTIDITPNPESKP